MAIYFPVSLAPINKDEYHALDYKVMRFVFDVHNELGNLCQEKVYCSLIAERCVANGLRAGVEVPVTVSHGEFKKTYFVDLLIEDKILYEFKAADSLVSQNRNQLMHYLFLTGGQWGKLVNMGSASVEHEYITSTISFNERFQFKVFDQGWVNLDAQSQWFKNAVHNLLQDWGIGIDIQLLYDAMTFFLGGEEYVRHNVPVQYHNQTIGLHNVYLLNEQIVFVFTALKQGFASYEKNLQRLLEFLPIKAAHCVNINRHTVTFKTLLKKSSCQKNSPVYSLPGSNDHDPQ